MGRKKKFKFYCPDPEQHFSRADRNYPDRKRYVESYEPFDNSKPLSKAVNEVETRWKNRVAIENERIAHKKEIKERAYRKKAEKAELVILERLDRFYDTMPEWFVVPGEFGTITFLSSIGTGSFKSEVFDETIYVRFNKVEGAVEVKFSRHNFEKIELLLKLSKYEVFRFDRTRCKLLVAGIKI